MNPIEPGWRVAAGVYVAYNAIIFATWAAVGADYRDLVSEGLALKSLLLPLGLGALFAFAAVTRLGWWRPALFEASATRPRWPAALPLAAMLGFLALHAVAIPWSAASPTHLALLAAAALLVGFNEELVTRGVLVTGFRGSRLGEVGVWFGSSFLFGAMHVPNALFGIPWGAGVLQGMLAFTMGSAFYAIRRASGSLWLPMALHASWDFVSFTAQATHGSAPRALFFQFATYVLALFAVAWMLTRARRT